MLAQVASIVNTVIGHISSVSKVFLRFEVALREWSTRVPPTSTCRPGPDLGGRVDPHVVTGDHGRRPQVSMPRNLLLGSGA